MKTNVILHIIDYSIALDSYSYCSLRHRQSNPLVYTGCVLVHDILFQILLSRKDIYSRFWLVKTIVWPNTR